MLRGGPSAQDNKQKQKKRLSFKDPEVEGPLRDRIYQSRTLTRPPKNHSRKAVTASLEDLTLEDQALQIAQNVGSAFSDLSLADNGAADFAAFEEQRETEIRDNSPSGFEACQPQNFGASAEEEDLLVRPLFDQIMRGPPFESGGDSGPTKNCIPPDSPHSVQHQVQLLRYQLDQQNQQTQMAMHQVQLLQDQVNAESAARRKAQEQNNHLMHQNQELLSHIERLFQQIEDLERQVHVLEQQRGQGTGRRAPPPEETRPREESKAPIAKQPTFTTRPRTEPANDKLMPPNRSLAARRSSLTSMKPLACTTSKTSPNQNSTPTPAARKIPGIASSRPSSVQVKAKDTGAKEKDTLRIGDASPPVQSVVGNPFESSWRLKPQDSSTQSRSRAESFSSYAKKPQDSSTAKKSSLFDGNHSSFSAASISGKKHSSSTSDLYNPPSAFQGKSSLMIDEPPSGVKSSVSSLSISSISKLPRYQPYTGWQRRASQAGEEEQEVSAISRDAYKSSQQASLFNR